MTLDEIPFEIKKEVINHAKAEQPREACGLLIVIKGRIKYFRCENLAQRNNEFLLNPDDYARFEEKGEVVAIVHSHCNEPETPSEADKYGCEASGLTWFIVSIPGEQWAEINPSGYVQPLIGRKYLYGVFDCYSLVRDFYRMQRGIELLDFPRMGEWWLRGEEWFLDNFKKAGFEEVPFSEARNGDLLFFKVGANVTNHCGILLEDGFILHHCIGRLSSRDVFSDYWRQKLTKAVTFKNA